MGWNLPPGCTDADIDRAAQGDEPYEPATCGEQEAEAWEYWREKATKLEAHNYQLRKTIIEIRECLAHLDDGPR